MKNQRGNHPIDIVLVYFLDLSHLLRAKISILVGLFYLFLHNLYKCFSFPAKVNYLYTHI